MKRLLHLAAPAAGALAALQPAAAFAQDSDAAAGLFGGTFALCCTGIFSLVMIALLVMWVWMLIDVIKRPEEQFEGGMSKVVWIVLMVFFSYIAAIIYYFMIYKKLGKAA